MEGRIHEMEAIHRLTADYYAKTAQKYGLRFFHIRYLIEICEEPGRQQDSFVRYGNLNKSSVARHFAFLEENNFIVRRAWENDRRILLVFPTEKAIAAIPEFKKVLQRWENALLQDFSQQENKALQKVLLKMKRNAETFLLTEEQT